MHRPHEVNAHLQRKKATHGAHIFTVQQVLLLRVRTLPRRAHSGSERIFSAGIWAADRRSEEAQGGEMAGGIGPPTVARRKHHGLDAGTDGAGSVDTASRLLLPVTRRMDTSDESSSAHRIRAAQNIRASSSAWWRRRPRRRHVVVYQQQGKQGHMRSGTVLGAHRRWL
jgi:hypothetical protein